MWGNHKKSSNNKFSQVGSLNKHKQNVHGNDNFNGQYSCDICGKTYSRPDYLKKHQLTHSNESMEQSDDYIVGMPNSENLEYNFENTDQKSATAPFHNMDPAWYSGHFMSDLLDAPGSLSGTMDVPMSGDPIASPITLANNFKPKEKITEYRGKSSKKSNQHDKTFNHKHNLKRHSSSFRENEQGSLLMSKIPKTEIMNTTDGDEKKNANKNVTPVKNWGKFITENEDQCYYCGNMFKLTKIEAHMKSSHKTYSKTMHGPKRAESVNKVAEENNKKDMCNRFDPKNSDDISDKSTIRQENVAKQSQCYYCGRLFTSLANIKSHMREFHGTYIATMHGPPKGKKHAIKNIISSRKI